MSAADKLQATPADSLDRDLVARALKKVAAGKQAELTRHEHAALKRYEKEREERTRWQYYASIPQKHWRKMSGRQTKVINEQAERYDIPFGGATVNLPAVVKATHDFLADNKYKLARDDDELMVGAASPALERYREERAQMARLDRLEREGLLVDRDVVRLSLAKIAAILRLAGDSLQRQFGQSAANIMFEALSDSEAEITRSFQQLGQEGEVEPDADQ